MKQKVQNTKVVSAAKVGTGKSRSSKDWSGLPKVSQNSAEPLGLCRKVLQNVLHTVEFEIIT